MAFSSDSVRELEALLLDLDGTLLDWEAPVRAGIAAASEQASRLTGAPAGELAAAYIGHSEAFWAARPHDWSLGRVTNHGFAVLMWQRVLGRYEASTLSNRAADAALELADRYEAAESAAFRAYDEVPSFFEAVARRGLRLALITNGASRTQRAKLAALGIAEHFQLLVISSELGARKPDPTVFHHALAGLGGIAPSRAAHVGDSLDDDIAGAQAAGVHSVWVNRTGAEPPVGAALPTLQVASLTELSHLLG